MIFTASLFIAAAATGAFFRLATSLTVPAPWATFLVNLLGSLAIGFLFVYLEKSTPQAKMIVFLAFLGSLTTFSTFALDCVRLMSQSHWRMLALYVVLTNLTCILGCLAGWQIAKKLVIKL